MASAQSPARPIAVAAGVGLAALLAAATTALPAAADSHGSSDHGNSDHGNSAAAPGQTQSHSNNGKSSAHSGGQSSGQSSSQSSSGTESSGHNPPGNNGTVFIHDMANDQHPHNVPHVSCNFWVDFFNFDNKQSVKVSFTGQAPTGKDQALGGTTTKTLEADDAAGAGNDWDGELAFTADQLGVDNLGPAAHQGYHVKMTVDTFEPGGHKYKVFWLQPCSTATSTAATTSSPQTPTQPNSAPQTVVAGESTTAGQTPTGQTTSGQASGGALAPAAASNSNAGIPTEVLGTKFTRGAAAPAAAATASSLPFTGAEIGGMVLAAAMALGGGALLMVAGRRRRRAGSH